MEQKRSPESPLPSLDDFEMYYKTDIRPANKRVLDRRRTFWERTDKKRLAIVGAIAALVVIQMIIAPSFFVSAAAVLGPFIVFALIFLVFIAFAFVVDQDQAEEKASLEVAKQAGAYFGWSQAPPGERLTRVNLYKIARLLNGSVKTSWAAQRVVNGAKIWICDAEISDSETTDFDGFLVSLPVTAPAKFKLTANPILPAASGVSRSFLRLRRWLREDGWDEIRTGNKDFDQHFVVHASDAEAANTFLSFLLLQRILEQRIELRERFDVSNVDVSFAVLHGQLLIAVNCSRQLIPQKFDYKRLERAVPMIHKSFVALDHLVEDLVIPMKNACAKTVDADSF